MTSHSPQPLSDRKTPRSKAACAFLGFLSLVAGSVGFCAAAYSSSDDNAHTPCRIGFSSSMFTEVNENDVKASTKAWIQVLLRERGVPVDPEVRVLSGIEEISRAVRSKHVDAISLTTNEYWSLRGEMRSSQVVVGFFNGRVTEEYVLLVHRESGIDQIGDLRGRNIAFFLNQRMSLAFPWIETLLLREGLGRTREFFGRVTQLNKLARVILPVFFRQSDACVVTRRGFETMSELNPQVGRQLKIVAVSPELIPAGFFFRGDFSPSITEKALAEFDKVHTTPTGLQALTVFQSGRLEVHPISVLESAFELLDGHSRLCTAASAFNMSEAARASRGRVPQEPVR